MLQPLICAHIIYCAIFLFLAHYATTQSPRNSSGKNVATMRLRTGTTAASQLFIISKLFLRKLWNADDVICTQVFFFRSDYRIYSEMVDFIFSSQRCFKKIYISILDKWKWTNVFSDYVSKRICGSPVKWSFFMAHHSGLKNGKILQYIMCLYERVVSRLPKRLKSKFFWNFFSSLQCNRI